MLGASQNKIMGMSGSVGGQAEEKIVPFRKVLYDIETGKSDLFTSMEEVVDAEESGKWVNSPAKTKKGEYEALPKECEFYVNRKCVKGLAGKEPSRRVEPTKELIDDLPPKQSEPPESGKMTIELPIEKIESGTSDSEQPESLIPALAKAVKAEKKKFLSQMSKGELVEEAKLHNLNFSDGKLTKSAMKKAINKAKDSKK